MEIHSSSDDSFYSAAENSDEFKDQQEEIARVSVEYRTSMESFTAYSNGSSILTAACLLPWDPTPRLKNKTVANLSFRLIQDVDISAFFPSKNWVLSFAQDGRFLAIGGDSGMILVYEIAPRQDLSQMIKSAPLKTLHEHSGPISSLDWARPAGRHSDYSLALLSSSLDRTVKLWTLNSDTSIYTYTYPCEVNSVAFDLADSGLFVAGCSDKSFKLSPLSGENKILISLKTNRKVTCLKYSPTGELLAVGMKKGEVWVYEVVNSDVRFRKKTVISCKNRRGFLSGGRPVANMVFKDNLTLVITTMDSRIRIVDLRNGDILQKMKGHKLTSQNSGAFLSNEGSHILCGSDNGLFHFWKIDTLGTESYSARSKKTSEFVTVAPGDLVHYVKKHCQPIEKHKVCDIFVCAGAKSTLRVFYWFNNSS